ncbi:hypothetical protein MRX96_039614 [Rhipicephalus microplus]
MDVDAVRGTKRKAAEPTAVITTADPNVSQIDDRIERLEFLFDKMSTEQTIKNQQLTESIGALPMALANLTARLDSLPALTESAAVADVIKSQTPSSTPTQLHCSRKSHNALDAICQGNAIFVKK